uniref:Uncharacterized protein n=1 Tax=Picea sitchensis TaxID=3332 RepID=A9NKS6_PICSI|nr:unknown [Picea sitchensis]
MAQSEMTKKPLEARLYVKAHRMPELGKLRENGPIDKMLWCIIYVLFAHSMLLLLFSSFSADSSFNICKILQNPIVRFYLAAMAAAIVVMLLFALCNLIAQVVRMCKETDNLEDLSPQPFDI